MPHKMFISTYETGPLGYLISTRKAFYILLTHKIRDSRLQLFLFKWVGALLVAFGAGVCGFKVLPTLLATGFFAPGVCFCALVLWLGSCDMFLAFALEDERFYNLATKTHALDVFEDTELSLPQPGS